MRQEEVSWNHPPNFQHTTWNTPGPWNRPVGTDLWNHTIGTNMALERAYYVGTGYLNRDDPSRHVAVSLGDVAVVAAEWWDGTEPVIVLYAPNGHMLCALPWPEGVADDDESGGVRWFLRAAADITSRAPW